MAAQQMTLRITVEIIPYGDENRKRVLDVVNVSNITFDHNWENEYGEVSDYIVRGHRRKAGFWALIRKVIDEK